MFSPMLVPKSPRTMRAIESLSWFPRHFVSAFRRLRDLLATPQVLRELGAQVEQLSNRIDQLHLRKVEGELKAEITAQLGFSFHDLEQQFGEAKAIFHSRFNDIEKVQLESKNLVTQLGTSFRSRLDAVDNDLFEAKNLLGHVNTNVEARLNSLDNHQSEARNQLIHLDTSIHARMNTFENERLAGLRDQVHELAAIQLEMYALTKVNRAEWVQHPEERYKPATAETFNSYLAQANKEFPHAYLLWKEHLDAILAAFRQTKVGNAAQGRDVYSRIFRSFVEIHGRGRVLNLGCGIFGRPYYLNSYPAIFISGIDPLPPIENLDFEFVHGISEYLPWPDESFSTVISATSLDHCLSLDRSLAEIRRVLRAGGRFLLWIGSNPGSPKYKSDGSQFPAADQFHLFHFDVAWFDPMLEQMFDITDCIQLQKTGYSHVMYCLVKKNL